VSSAPGCLEHISRMQRIRLELHGPFPLCGERTDTLAGCSQSCKAGIYLWTVRQGAGDFRISYIGETGETFHQRSRDHITQILGGNYRVLRPDSAEKGVQEVVWNGLWRRGTRHLLPDFLRRYEELAPLIKKHILQQEIFVGPLACERRLRKRIEGAIARQIRSSPVASSLLAEDIRYTCRRDDEPPVAVQIVSAHGIEGLPTQMVA
jgi:hypothetical protein